MFFSSSASKASFSAFFLAASAFFAASASLQRKKNTAQIFRQPMFLVFFLVVSAQNATHIAPLDRSVLTENRRVREAVSVNKERGDG